MAEVAKTMRSVLHRNLVFIHGKGGVGKTAVSKAIAQGLSSSHSKTLWVTLEDPTHPTGALRQLGPSLWHLNADFIQAFEEYASMKIGVATLAKIFLQNKLIRYLAKAAPGIHELVLLGKIWYERRNYSHVVVDLPSTGHGLALFQSVENFVKLFTGGPLNKDAAEMLVTFRDPQLTGHLIVTLPEEMPIRESLELNHYLSQIIPGNAGVFLVNRLFPEVRTPSGMSELPPPSEWPSPVPDSAEDYSRKRFALEHYNLRLLRDEKIRFGELEYVPPQAQNDPESHPSLQLLVSTLSERLHQKDYL